MIKEFIKRLISMLFYAWGAAAISTLIVILFFYNDFDLSHTLMLLAQIATMGIVIGLPILLLSAFWFWYVRKKTNFLFWTAVPVLLSIIEVVIGVMIVGGLREENDFVMKLMFVFSFSSFQMSLYMWITYSKFQKSKYGAETSSQQLMEVQNVRN